MKKNIVILLMLLSVVGKTQSLAGWFNSYLSAGELPTIVLNSVTPGNAWCDATLDGTVTSDNGFAITERGFVYSTTQTPTISNNKIVISGTTGNYTTLTQSLNAITTYYFRAYATSSIGTGYSNQISITTRYVPGGNAVVATNIGRNSATVYSTLDFTGNTIITLYKAWDLNGGGDYHQVSIPVASGYTSFDITGLVPNTQYIGYFIYETDCGLTSHMGQPFTTLTGAIPTVLTASSPTSIGSTTADIGGIVSDNGGYAASDMGICWSSTNANPTLADSHASKYNGNEQGFNTNLTGLSPSTLYYYRAYATNTLGTGYGTVYTFTTISSCTLATLTTTSISNITSSTASGGGNISSDGGCSITARGICWSTSQNPTIANSHTSDGTGTGIFTSTLTGLTCGTLYYVRAYATNNAGTSYGSQVSFSVPYSYTVQSDNNTLNLRSSLSPPVLLTGTQQLYLAYILSSSCNPNYNTFVVESVTLNGDGDAYNYLTFTVNGSTVSYPYSVSINGLSDVANTGMELNWNDTNGTLLNDIPVQYLTMTFHIIDINGNVGASKTINRGVSYLSNFPATFSSITSTSVTVNSTCYGTNVTDRGIYYGTTTNPTTKVSYGDGNVGNFAINLTGLTPNTTYYVKAYVTGGVIGGYTQYEHSTINYSFTTNP